MGCRGAGEGSVYQRKDGGWVAQYKGRYRYAKDKDAAKAKLYKMLTETEDASRMRLTRTHSLS